MTNPNAILISKDGKLLAMNKPEKPNPNDTWAATKQMKYEHLLQSSISAAEKEGIEFRNENEIRYLFLDDCICCGYSLQYCEQCKSTGKYFSKQIYDCPSGWEIRVEIEEKYISSDDTEKWRLVDSFNFYNETPVDERYKYFRKVALLVRVEEEKTYVHRVTLSGENQPNDYIKEPNILTIEDDLAIEVIARFTGNSRGTPIAKQGFIDGALWMKKRLTSTTNKETQ